MKSHDRVEDVTTMQDRVYVRMRVYAHADTTALIVSPVFGIAGHLINRRASWLATHAASVLNLPTTARFFSCYVIDAGDELRTCYHEFTFRWIGRIAIDIASTKPVSAEVVSSAIGETVQYMDEVLAKVNQVKEIV